MTDRVLSIDGDDDEPFPRKMCCVVLGTLLILLRGGMVRASKIVHGGLQLLNASSGIKSLQTQQIKKEKVRKMKNTPHHQNRNSTRLRRHIYIIIQKSRQTCHRVDRCSFKFATIGSFGEAVSETHCLSKYCDPYRAMPRGRSQRILGYV